MLHILVDIRICVCWTVRSKNTLKQGKLWQFLKGTAKPKVKEKVIDFEELKGVRTPGGALGYFLGGYVPPGIPNWHPVLEKIYPKIDTPF